MSFISKWNKFLLKESEKPNSKLTNRLVVFDFDGTLFRSPNPPDDFKGNWWASKESLEEPHVPKEPDRSYWFKDTIAAAEEAFGDSKTISVMMTGRMQRNFEDRIKELLDQNGIVFHEIFMNESGQDTVDFKLKEVKKILKEYPNIKVVEFWDDKRDHLNKFRKELESDSLKIKINKVDNVIDEARKRSMFTNEAFMPPEGADISDPEALEKNISNMKTMTMRGFDILPNMGRSKTIRKVFQTVNIYSITDEGYKELISKIEPLKKNTATPITFGTMGEVFKLSNGKILKIFSNKRADDLEWYQRNIEKMHSKKGDLQTMRFERWGEVDLKDLKVRGEIDRSSPDTLYWVEMDEIIDFKTFLENTKRDLEKAHEDLGRIYFWFMESYKKHTLPPLPIKTNAGYQPPLANAPRIPKYKMVRGKIEKENAKSLVIKGAMKGFMKKPLSVITNKEANEIISSLYTFYNDGNKLEDPLHAGNIGIQPQSQKDRPKFIIIDI